MTDKIKKKRKPGAANPSSARRLELATHIAGGRTINVLLSPDAAAALARARALGITQRGAVERALIGTFAA